MVNYIKCRVCGYVVREGKVGGVCPACGAPETAFEPHTLPISEARYKALRMHLHPVAVHFPQALSTLLVLALALGLLVGGDLQVSLYSTAQVLAGFLVLLTPAAIGSGLRDGKVRFKRLTTPALRKKVLLGGVFFAVALGNVLLVLLIPLEGTVPWLALVLGTGNVGLSVLLGLVGGSLLDSVLPNGAK